MNKQIHHIGKIFCAGLISWMLFSCNQSASSKATKKTHLVEISRPGALLYVDKVANNRVMADAGEHGQFVSYRIGFYDSIAHRDKKVQREATVYYQYKMSSDWKAVIAGDSIAPVFYQPMAGLNSQVNEGVLVFELPGQQEPDALVYHDATGLWQTQIIVLKEIK